MFVDGFRKDFSVMESGKCTQPQPRIQIYPNSNGEISPFWKGSLSVQQSIHGSVCLCIFKFGLFHILSEYNFLFIVS